MISSEAKRTLVKSPPELWTELSDPAALARHLGEFGEIRITRAVPEKVVEWKSDSASGRVLLKPSGWGTKVTLTVTGELFSKPPDPTGQAASHRPAGADEPQASVAEQPQQTAPAGPLEPTTRRAIGGRVRA